MSIFATNKAIAQLAFRLGELDTEVRQLKSQHKHLELEWEELYDKVRHQMARMSRRQKRDEKDELNGPDPEIPTEDYPGVDPISASILRRRHSGGVPR